MRAGLVKSYLSLDADLAKLGLEPFHAGLSLRQKMSYTAALVMVWGVVLVFLDPWAAFLILACGLWVVWNRNNTITRLEKKLFITVLDTALLFAFLERFSVILQAAGLLILAAVAHILYTWRRA